MNERMYRGSRDLWLPALVVVLGWVLSGLVWRALTADREAQLTAAAQETTRQSEDFIAHRLGSQSEALHSLADLWARFGMPPLPEWRAGADLLVDAQDGLLSVAWIDLDEPNRRIAVGETRSASEVDLDESEARRFYPESRVRGPERDAGGAPAYRVFVPVETAAEHAGVLVARVRVADLLDPLLRSRSPGYAVRVTWNDQVIYAQGVASGEPRHDWWRSEGSVPLPYGGEWRIVHRPTAELAAARLTPLPDYLLAAGLVASLLLGAIVHQWRVLSRQTRFQEATNRALEEKGLDLERLNLELERRVADRTERLEDAVTELEAFNYSVSHDLRSPLGAVLNFAAILEEDYRGRALDEDGVALIARIQSCASRATHLLEDLLQLSRAGRASLEIEPIDMTELAREMFAQARAAEEDDDVELVVGPLPAAEGDRRLLGTVFTNLFTNAIKYSRGREKRTVTVKGRVEVDECIFEVNDNGSGFDMRFAGKLFGLFERLHGDEEIEGTGVGLAMVARIVKRHGGRVWAESELDVGSRFAFALPRPKGVQ